MSYCTNCGHDEFRTDQFIVSEIKVNGEGEYIDCIEHNYDGYHSKEMKCLRCGHDNRTGCTSEERTEEHFHRYFDLDTSLPSKEYDNDLAQLAIHGEDLKVAKDFEIKNERKIWTLIEGEEGHDHILAGLHHVDAIHFILTKNEWSWDDESYRCERID